MIDFTQTADFAAWVLVACRNIVGRAVVVVLERCLFEWMEEKADREAALDAHKQPLVERLAMLEHETALNSIAREIAKDLRNYLERYRQGKCATDELPWLNDPQQFPRMLPLQELFKRLATPPARVRCTALVYTLETTVVYEEELYTLNYNISFVIALQALLWTAEFRRHLFNFSC